MSAPKKESAPGEEPGRDGGTRSHPKQGNDPSELSLPDREADRARSAKYSPEPDPRKAAERYIAQGFQVVPLKRGAKGCYIKGWPDKVFGPEHFSVETNVGVKTGEKSGGLTDIDLDDPHAVAIADVTLTEFPNFGRRTNPRSHRVMRVRNPGKTKKWRTPDRMILEMRCNGSQTVFPGSVHPSGEPIGWTDGEPAEIPERGYEELCRLCDMTAFLAVVVRQYPSTDGNRDDICMALSGVLLRMGHEPERVDDLVRHVAESAGDEESESRGKAQQTQAQLDADAPATGMPTLLDLLGISDEAVRRKMTEWAGIAKRKVEVALTGDEVDITPGSLDTALDRIQDKLLAKEVPLFQRGGELVMPVRLDADQVDTHDVTRKAGSLVLHRPKGAGLLSILVKHASFYKLDSRGRPKPADPDVKFANVLGQGRERWRFRPLASITGVPVFRPDGTILQVAGYDPLTQLWYDPGGWSFPAVPRLPTKEDALAAVKVLWRPFRKYPIPDPACRSVLLSGLMTPVILPTVPAVPGIGVSASAPGFGKTKIQECIGVLAMGSGAASMNQGPTDEEDAKRIDAALLTGDPILAIDNVQRPVNGATLCSVITNSTHKVRVLGKSEVPMVSSRVLFLFNGNNLAFAEDMTRRVLLVEIRDDEVEKPEARDFDFDPVDACRETRGEMVAAALTILRAWHLAGRPRPKEHKTLGSFEGWEPVRLALLWLGEADPVDTQELVVEDDPQREADRDLLELLLESQGAACFKAADLSNPVEDYQGRPTPLGQALLAGRSWSTKRAGNRLRPLGGRWIDGIRLARVKEDGKKGHLYRIERRDGRHPDDDEGLEEVL